MERHSVPQNIMEVEFKLFGSFSVRQFGYLASGFLISTMIYFFDWPFLVKTILIIFTSAMGLFLAIIKINGQPSSVFVLNFIHALFNSQSRVWKKTSVVPESLRETKNFDADDVDRQIASHVKKRLPSTNTIPLHNLAMSSVVRDDNKIDNEVDKYESMRLNQIDKYYKFEIDKLNKEPTAPVVKRSVELPSLKPKPAEVFNPVSNNESTGLAQKITPEPSPQVLINQEGYKTMFRSVDEVRSGNKITPNTQQEMSRVAKLKREIAKLQSEVKEIEPAIKPTSHQTKSMDFDNKNIMKGRVVDKNNRPLHKAIIYLKNPKGELVRKFVTNENGEFVLKNPLLNGDYYVDIELEGFKFGRYKVILSGEKIYSFQFKSK